MVCGLGLWVEHMQHRVQNPCTNVTNVRGIELFGRRPGSYQRGTWLIFFSYISQVATALTRQSLRNMVAWISSSN